MAARLSNRLVVNTNPPRGERIELRDTVVKGLVCDCTARTKTFRLRHQSRGKRSMTVLGTYPAVDVDKARAMALDILYRSKMARTDRITVAELADHYIELYAKPNKKTWKHDEGDLEKHIVSFFGKDTYADDIQRRDVANFTVHLAKKYPGRPRANRVYACARKMFRWAASMDKIEGDPTVGVSQPVKKSAPRARIITDVEIRQLWLATNGEQVHHSTRGAIRMCLLTGLRPTEVFKMEWSWIIDDRIVVPVGKTKTKQQQHIVPRSRYLDELLKSLPKTSKFVFPAKDKYNQQITPTTCGQLLRRKLKVDYILHDVRRTIASWLVSQGVGMDTARSILGHRPAGVLGDVYLHETAQLPQVKKALLMWQAHLSSLVGSTGTDRPGS